jgi:GTP-binding protein
MIPIVAIVGRPNVGKSTLFNRLAGIAIAIVHDEPGVTRDRHYADVHAFGRTFTLIDTGGFDPGDTDAIGRGIARHVRAAVEEADVIMCILDGQTPPTEADAAAVRMLRQAHKPVIYIANRVDHPRQLEQAAELYSLGIELIPVSALHGRGMPELGEALLAGLPPITPEEAAALDAPPPPRRPALPRRSESKDLEGDADEIELRDAAVAAEAELAAAGPPPVPRVALIGRPNAGKSSLLNRLSGQERSLVDDRPGTTRDPVDARISFKGHEYVIVDTAGIRRRSKVEPGVESQSVMQALRSVQRADVVVLLCDAAEGLAEQDARLLGLVAERSRPIVVGLNKIDLLNARQRKAALESAQDQLHFAPWAPIVSFSNKTGEGATQLMNTVRRAFAQYASRIPTAELNKFLQATVERNPPPGAGSKSPRLFFMTQAQASPPVFIIMCSAAEEIKDAYRRFITNQLRKTFGFESVPLVVRYKNRRRRE